MSGPVGSAVPVVQGVPLDRYSAGRGRQAVQTSLGTQSIYSLPEGVRKRDVRGLARVGSLAAAAVLALNIVTFHVAPSSGLAPSSCSSARSQTWSPPLPTSSRFARLSPR